MFCCVCVLCQVRMSYMEVSVNVLLCVRVVSGAYVLYAGVSKCLIQFPE
jgi:hypothetical protein